MHGFLTRIAVFLRRALMNFSGDSGESLTKTSMFDSARIACSGEFNIFTRRRLPPQTWRANMKSILDNKFQYTNSVQTDLKKTFARVRRELCRLKQADAINNDEAAKKVLQIAARRAALRS
jgi:hypothetical protein